jgi:hypothetical protein
MKWASCSPPPDWAAWMGIVPYSPSGGARETPEAVRRVLRERRGAGLGRFPVPGEQPTRRRFRRAPAAYLTEPEQRCLQLPLPGEKTMKGSTDIPRRTS